MTDPVPAGQMLLAHLDARGWKQTDFAEIIGRPNQTVNEIINGKKEITRETAAQIGAATGIKAGAWLHIQDAYKLWELSRNEAHLAKLAEIRKRVGEW
jgi:HTH-type transcriptional regulator/antitoxin HigA